MVLNLPIGDDVGVVDIAVYLKFLCNLLDLTLLE